MEIVLVERKSKMICPRITRMYANEQPMFFAFLIRGHWRDSRAPSLGFRSTVSAWECELIFPIRVWDGCRN